VAEHAAGARARAGTSPECRDGPGRSAHLNDSTHNDSGLAAPAVVEAGELAQALAGGTVCQEAEAARPRDRQP
jgi:hypothetical protein